MTNEQKNRVAAMNASGMSVDEIVIDTGLDKKEIAAFVAERNEKKGKRGHPISAQTKQAIIEWYQSGHKVAETAKKFGVDPKTVKAAVGLLPAKEKEPAPAPTETSSVMSDDDTEVSSIDNNSTDKPKSQAPRLRGVAIIGALQTKIEEAYGTDAELMSIRADSDSAELVFCYGGRLYELKFGEV